MPSIALGSENRKNVDTARKPACFYTRRRITVIQQQQQKQQEREDNDDFPTVGSAV